IASTTAIYRLIGAEHSGKISSVKSEAGVERPDLVIDLQKEVSVLTQVYAFTFHPGYRTNRFVYVCYVLKDGLPEGTHVSRFTMKPTDPPQVDPASEKILITWISGGHNGCSLK